jgi:hypothetical protein
MIIFTTNSNASFSIPIELLFWGFIAAYVIHILEESVLGESFVDKVRKNFIPVYDWKKFFGFNTFLLCLNVVAIIVYDIAGGNWIIFPLSLAVERTLNGIWHLGETMVTRKFSSGLLASTLTWILMYLLIRYSLLPGEISSFDFYIALGIGALITTFMFTALLNKKLSASIFLKHQ